MEICQEFLIALSLCMFADLSSNCLFKTTQTSISS